MRVMLHILFMLLVIISLAGCRDVNHDSFMYYYHHPDDVSVNKYLSLRRAAATPREKEEFEALNRMIIEKYQADEYINLFAALECLANMTFTNTINDEEPSLMEDRIKIYEKTICILLSNPKKRQYSNCLIWINARLDCLTKKIIESVFQGAFFPDMDSSDKASTFHFLAAVFGFYQDGFYFTECSDGAKSFPLKIVYDYWKVHADDVMTHRENITTYSRYGYYIELDSPNLRLPSYSIPKAMGLHRESFPRK